MPYIPQDRRADVLAEMREHGTHWTPKNAGDLNFAVTCFIDNFIFENGCRYANLNEMIGALECCKLELYRRLAAPYEDQVLEANVVESGILMSSSAQPTISEAVRILMLLKLKASSRRKVRDGEIIS